MFDLSKLITKEQKDLQKKVDETNLLIAERDRRAALGFDYNFNDARGIHRFGTTPADLAGWDKVSKLCSAYVDDGRPNELVYIKTDTAMTYVIASEWPKILIKAGIHEQPIYQAYFNLKSLQILPENYTDDQYWIVV